MDVTENTHLDGVGKPSYSPKYSLGRFLQGFGVCHPPVSFGKGKGIHQKMVVATIRTIINFETRVKSMGTWSDQTNSLMVQLNHSNSRTCYFLDAQLREILRSAISDRSGSNSI